MSDQTKLNIPEPAINEETKPFWEGTARKEFLLKKCIDCTEFHFYPRSKCPFCHSLNTEWVKSQGIGTIYSYSVVRRAKVPFVFAYVTLDEGVTVLTNIVECDVDALEIGHAVEAVFYETSEGTFLPYFRPRRS